MIKQHRRATPSMSGIGVSKFSSSSQPHVFQYPDTLTSTHALHAMPAIPQNSTTQVIQYINTQTSANEQLKTVLFNALAVSLAAATLLVAFLHFRRERSLTASNDTTSTLEESGSATSDMQPGSTPTGAEDNGQGADSDTKELFSNGSERG
ncbi:hypothetical protein EJ04DRAFT_527589 [Polyplosphaeria fusca]|uniref:Uncharacterized protein n=1 Tax=Polyplosphaeria fusca TaxID=682080 RepID=A0A9P4QNQ7_9PLEO|nr:hypothetical protein EJ04DRAFT_527589 [Polyplosphaeria fusca]